ncbi:MAG TPA: hypothetical protein VNN25_21855 [Thermoanaerobaculia bacterium]|nr:hypothetical protein [Thermoanaerobaculia bacterium]
MLRIQSLIGECVAKPGVAVDDWFKNASLRRTVLQDPDVPRYCAGWLGIDKRSVSIRWYGPTLGFGKTPEEAMLDCLKKADLDKPVLRC